MSVALSLVLVLVGAISVLAVRGVVPGPDADQVRGFCVVGGTGAFVVALAVLGIGLFWDDTISDTVALIALFALVAYYLVAVVINVWPRPGDRRRASDPAAPSD